jgi:hypothetical protein
MIKFIRVRHRLKARALWQARWPALSTMKPRLANHSLQLANDKMDYYIGSPS